MSAEIVAELRAKNGAEKAEEIHPNQDEHQPSSLIAKRAEAGRQVEPVACLFPTNCKVCVKCAGSRPSYTAVELSYAQLSPTRTGLLEHMLCRNCPVLRQVDRQSSATCSLVTAQAIDCSAKRNAY